MTVDIRHIGLVVTDLDLALHLWCEIFEFRVMKRMEESGPYIDAMLGLAGVQVTTVKLAAPSGYLIELLRFHSHPDRPTWEGRPYSTGLTHIALTVTDLDAICVKLAAIGATFNAPPQFSPDGTVRVTYCMGPEGVLIELVEIIEPAAGEHR